jgi:hypothetical protein
MTVIDDLACLSAAVGQAHAENHIVQTAFEQLKQVQTGQTPAALGDAEVAAELAFENAINAANFLLGAQLASVIGFTIAAAVGRAALAVLARGETTFLKGALRAEAAGTLEE